MAPRRPIERNQPGTFIESQRGRRLLQCNGHIYRVNNKDQRRNNINWRCVKQTICSGTANTAWFDLNAIPVNTDVAVAERMPHTNSVDHGEIAVQTVRRDLRERAQSEPNVPPSLLVQEVRNSIEDEETLMRMPERQTLLRADLFMLLKNQKYTDVTFQVDNKIIKAHRLILAARSEYFDAMFNGNFSEENSNRFIITDTDADTFGAVLIYLYTAHVPNVESKAEKVFKAADKLLLKHLKKECGAFISKHINLANVLKNLELADLYYEPELKNKCLKFIKINHAEVIKQGGWQLLKQNNARLMIEVLGVITGEAKV